jgi:hypothetical protein
MIMARTVTVSGSMRIVDDEDIVANEIERVQFAEARDLDEDQPEELIHVEGRAGGEVRVELDMNMQLIRNNRVRIRGSTILFEGTSEENNDEDGRFDFSFVVRPGRTVSRSFRLRNTDEGGDFADISFTCSNSRT